MVLLGLREYWREAGDEKILDNFKETCQLLRRHDKEMAKANAFKSMLKLEGILKGCPEFKRDKRDRTFA